jgi:hypothetical protein
MFIVHIPIAIRADSISHTQLLASLLCNIAYIITVTE